MGNFTEEELTLLKEDGWVFVNPTYIYIPDDYDGCMADGEENIRRVIEGCRRNRVRMD